MPRSGREPAGLAGEEKQQKLATMFLLFIIYYYFIPFILLKKFPITLTLCLAPCAAIKHTGTGCATQGITNTGHRYTGA